MARCDYCGEEVEFPFKCNYCGLYLCGDHRLPPSHNCINIKAWQTRSPPKISIETRKYSESVVYSTIQLLSQAIRLPSFIIAVILSVIVLFLMFALGNPIIYGALALHYIPEVFALFFFGRWFKEIGFPWHFILLICVLGAVLASIGLRNFYAIIPAIILLLFIVLGFMVSKQKVNIFGTHLGIFS
ncbi:MAG: AN1-type zinc finger domain-containing protein [Nitrososphaeria archaeon]